MTEEDGNDKPADVDTCRALEGRSRSIMCRQATLPDGLGQLPDVGQSRPTPRNSLHLPPRVVTTGFAVRTFGW